MTDAITKVVPAMSALEKAKTPAQTKKIESASAAAIAWAKEEGDYELMVDAMKMYVLARRKTTELLKPFIKHGGNRQGQGNLPVTLMDKTGFTKMQWHRRVRELEVSLEDLEDYFDECVSNGWNPSLAGLLRHANGENPKPAGNRDHITCPNCGAVFSG
ncbi:MAG TPA: hypothetical protein VIY48_01630 [Candidatus Paceibacterota bacterium]